MNRRRRVEVPDRFCRLYSSFLLLCLLLPGWQLLYAQRGSKDSSMKMIDIKGDSLRGFKSETASYQRIIGSVVIQHEGTTMTCDSAHFYLDRNYVEAYSHVQIRSNRGTQAMGDYIQYAGADHTAMMRGNVKVVDSTNTLYTEVLTYNLSTRTGKYYEGGTLQTSENTVSSDEGIYEVNTKQAWFKKNVWITHPRYTISSKELTYNTNTKLIRFLDESTIESDSSIIRTSGGTYDAKNEKAVFAKRTTVQQAAQVITGDQLEFDEQSGWGKAKGHVEMQQQGGRNTLFSDECVYNKKSGYAKASGHVLLTDTVEKMNLLCGTAEYNDHSKFMLATDHPKLITLADQDSTFIRADTMMLIRERDLGKLSLQTYTEGSRKNKTTFTRFNLLMADSTWISKDTPVIRVIVANHHIKVFADSMQAVCDSLSYSQADSTFRLFKSPVLWNKEQQSFADTIHIHTHAKKIDRLSLIRAAFLSSAHPYPGLYDQVAGQYMDAYMEEGSVREVRVNQNAESLYYAQDDQHAYIGMNRAECVRMTVYFENKQVHHIVMHDHPKGTFFPVEQFGHAGQYLNAFHTFESLRPRSRSDVMDDH